MAVNFIGGGNQRTLNFNHTNLYNKMKKKRKEKKHLVLSKQFQNYVNVEHY
jgi:hypothetical protein